MRSIITYFAMIAIFVWLASEGGFDRVDRGHLPIANSKAPTYVSDLPLPDPHDLNDISVVPAAQASELLVPEPATVTGAIVNLRAGPGLDYRMIDVLERGTEVLIEGDRVGDWLPVVDPVTGISAWIHRAYVASSFR
ncbi:MAG: SH3 domain-containing protein [Pseudomonadota bacterium]